jgi:hypothetical protein
MSSKSMAVLRCRKKPLMKMMMLFNDDVLTADVIYRPMRCRNVRVNDASVTASTIEYRPHLNVSRPVPIDESGDQATAV